MAVIALAMALGWAFARPQEAAAHAILERSLPVQNQQLERPPQLVETWYSEALERNLTSLEVLDTQGNTVQVGPTKFSDDPMYAAIEVPEDIGPGIYTVTYENVSQVDGHTWSGFFSFIVLEPDGSVPAGEALIPGGLAGQVGFLPDYADSALRWLGLVAAVALAGGVIFLAFVSRPAAEFLDDERLRRVHAAGAAAVAATTVPAAIIVALSTLGQLILLAGRLGGLADIDNILFDTRSGQLWLSRVGLSIALLLAVLPMMRSDAFRRSRQASLLAWPVLVGALGLLMTYSLASHAAAQGGAFWGVAFDFGHFLATAAWLGALPQLALLFWWTQRRLDEPQRLLYRANALDRFSWLAVIGVALLVGTGVFNGFVQLPRLPALWETTYGRVLIAKLALILPLLGVAGLNAVLLKPRLVAAIDELHAEDPNERPTGGERTRLETALRRLQSALPRTTVAEFLLGLAVLASVGVLAQSTTADGELRQEATAPAGEFAASEQEDDLDVELFIEPFGITVNTFTVTLTPQAEAELGEVLGVRLLATFDDPNLPPSAGISATRQELEPTDNPAVWTADAALLTQPGDWRIETRVRRRGLDDTSVRLSVPAVGGFLARADEPQDLFDLPFTYVGWNIVAGGAMVALGLAAFLVWHNRPPSWRGSTAASVGFSSAFGLIAGATLIFGVHGRQGEFPRTSPIETTEESLATGEQIFMNICAACHGATGEGDGPAAEGLELPPPRLGDHVPFHNDGTLFLWISEGIPLDSERKNMPSFKDRLTEDERWHLVNFLRATFDTGMFEPVLPEDLAEEDAAAPAGDRAP